MASGSTDVPASEELGFAFGFVPALSSLMSLTRSMTAFDPDGYACEFAQGKRGQNQTWRIIANAGAAFTSTFSPSLPL